MPKTTDQLTAELFQLADRYTQFAGIQRNYAQLIPESAYFFLDRATTYEIIAAELRNMANEALL